MKTRTFEHWWRDLEGVEPPAWSEPQWSFVTGLYWYVRVSFMSDSKTKCEIDGALSLTVVRMLCRTVVEKTDHQHQFFF